MDMKKVCILLLAALLYPSCSTAVHRNFRRIERDSVTANLGIPGDENLFIPYFDSLMNRPSADTMTVRDSEGKLLHLVQAVMDSTGTLVATEMLPPAIIVAKFKNVAERNGEVSIAFDINVPDKLLNSEWQVILCPKAVIQEDTLKLDKILISGERFRERQLRGYELYDKFISSIITDSSELIYTELLEVFIQRNIPELAALKSDTVFVADNTVKGIFGVTYNDAAHYFRRKIRTIRNNRRQNSMEAKYAKYVKEPYAEYGVRMDTVLRAYGKELVYNYKERFKTRPGLKKIDIIADGIIRCNGKEIHRISPTPPLTFYVASFSTLAEQKERFLTKIIERKVIADISANISFEPGKHAIDEGFDDNAVELATLKHNIADLIENREFNIDSLVITTSCSPEGNYAFNRQLSILRGESIASYFKDFVTGYSSAADSADKERFGFVVADGDNDEFTDKRYADNERITDFEFSVRNITENWDGLDRLIVSDTCITDRQGLASICSMKDTEAKKSCLSNHPEYPYILQNIYPHLRNVRFDFHLHRKGMVKDTVHTTVPDTIYRKGVAAMMDRDYRLALKYLGQYNDINSALAYLANDYNASAMKILESLPASGKRDYLLAIAHSRCGNENAAVQFFINAVEFDSSLAFRGNLDPEISVLVKKYNLCL